MENAQKVHDILSLPLALFMAYDKSKLDGKFDASDIQYIVGPLLKLPAVIDGASESLLEYQKMDDSSRMKCCQRLSAEFDIADDVLEAKVETAIEWLVLTGKLLGAFKP